MNKKNIFLWILALVVGFIFSLHNLIPYLVAQENPQFVYTPFNGGDENLYASQIREVYEGKFFSGDPFILETKNFHPFLPWLGSLIFGLLAKLFNSLELVFLLSDFFLPAIIFLLIFKFVFKITQHYWGSILSGLSTLFLYQLTTKFPPVTPGLLQGFWQTLTLKPAYFFSFSRLIPPQFTFIIFMVFLFSLYQTLITQNKSWPLLTGFFAGVLAYLYFYHWSASLMILAAAWALSLFISKSNSSRLFFALAISLFISSYFLFKTFAYSDLVKQISFGRLDGRFFEPLTSLRYGLISLFIFFIPLKKTVKQLLLSIFISAIVLMNLQVIVGFTLAPGHWPHSTFEPLLVISSFIILSISFKKYFPDSWRVGLLVIPVLSYALFNQIKITHQWQSLYFLSSSEVKLFNWLNQNTPPESVVLTLDKRLNRYLPVLTSNNLYLPYGSYSQLSTDQLWQRINLAFSLFHLTREGMTSYFTNTQFIGQLFDQTYNYHQKSNLAGLDFPKNIKNKISTAHPIFTFGVRYIPDNIKQQNINQSLQLINLPLKDRLCQFKLNYLLTTQQSEWQNLNPQYFISLFQADDLKLFHVKSDICQLNT